MTREQEIADLKAKIQARERASGWASNVAAMKKRLAELEASE